MSKKKTARLFIQAAQVGDNDTLQTMIKNRVDPCTVTNQDGSTALYVAVQNAQDQTIRLLLDHKADIHQRNIFGSAPLNVAVAAVENGTLKQEMLCAMLQEKNPLTFFITLRIFDNSAYGIRYQNILRTAAAEVQDAQCSTVAPVILHTHTLLPTPVIEVIRSFISAHRESPAEQAQTMQFLCNATR